VSSMKAESDKLASEGRLWVGRPGMAREKMISHSEFVKSPVRPCAAAVGE
jgi:hypothetical protein